MGKYYKCVWCGNEQEGDDLYKCDNGHIFCDSCKINSIFSDDCPRCNTSGIWLATIQDPSDDDDEDDDDE